MPRRANGAAIAALRTTIGISQRDLASRAKIAAPYLWQIEHSKREPSPVVLRRLADALGVKLDAITHVVPEPEPEGIAS